MSADAGLPKVVKDAIREIAATESAKPETPRLEEVARKRRLKQCPECKGTGKVRRKVGWSPTSGTIGIRIEYERVPCPNCREDEHVKYMTGCRGGPDLATAGRRAAEGGGDG